MQKITLITVGKLKEDFFKAAAAEYQKRLLGFCNFNEIVIEQVRLSESPTDLEIKAALEKEGKQIIEKCPQNALKIALCVEGKKITSEKLAEIIQNNADFESGNIVFIIGSSCGLADSVKAFCNLKISMSDMTFPHRLAHIMLLEQIYRGYTIIAGKHYHK